MVLMGQKYEAIRLSEWWIVATLAGQRQILAQLAPSRQYTDTR